MDFESVTVNEQLEWCVKHLLSICFFRGKEHVCTRTETRSYPSLLLDFFLCSARTKSWCAQRVFKPSKTKTYALPSGEKNWFRTPVSEVSRWYSRIIPLAFCATVSWLRNESSQNHVLHSQPMKHCKWGCNRTRLYQVEWRKTISKDIVQGYRNESIWLSKRTPTSIKILGEKI